MNEHLKPHDSADLKIRQSTENESIVKLGFVKLNIDEYYQTLKTKNFLGNSALLTHEFISGLEFVSWEHPDAGWRGF